MVSQQRRILILCKTYPSPSAKHAETSCVAGISESGELIRLYPVPFRLVDDAKQFRKWQWITVRVEKAANDHRRESHRLYVDTIECDPEPLPTKNGWSARHELLDKLTIYPDFERLEIARQSEGATLGIVRPSRVLGLDITPAEKPEWTDEEKKKLLQLQQQGNLFDDDEARSINVLRKIPAESGATRTPIPGEGGQQSGDCGQQVIAG